MTPNPPRWCRRACRSLYHPNGRSRVSRHTGTVGPSFRGSPRRVGRPRPRLSRRLCRGHDRSQSHGATASQLRHTAARLNGKLFAPSRNKPSPARCASSIGSDSRPAWPRPAGPGGANWHLPGHTTRWHSDTRSSTAGVDGAHRGHRSADLTLLRRATGTRYD